MKTAIKLTSAMTKKQLTIDIDNIGAVEDNKDGKNSGQPKVYTKHNGNFYVEESYNEIIENVFK